jgi:hypothetical protein
MLSLIRFSERSKNLVGILGITRSDLHVADQRRMLRSSSYDTPNIDKFVPESFTTPLIAATAQVHVPIGADYQLNPWLIIIGHG